MARRRNRGLFSWMIILVVLALASVGVYTVVNSSTGQSTVRIVKDTVKKGTKVVKAGAEAAKKGIEAANKKVQEVKKK